MNADDTSSKREVSPLLEQLLINKHHLNVVSEAFNDSSTEEFSSIFEEFVEVVMTVLETLEPAVDCHHRNPENSADLSCTLLHDPR